VLGRVLDGLPRRFEVATGDNRLSAVLVEFAADGRATGIERVSVGATP
jgi:calcineurin-like phosphoesterase